MTDKHDISRVNRIIDKVDPEYFILESKDRMNNLKTLHIAQQLRNNGCKDVQMKFYKGTVLKIQFMRTQNKQPNTAETNTAAAPAAAHVSAAAGSLYTPRIPLNEIGAATSISTIKRWDEIPRSGGQNQ